MTMQTVSLSSLEPGRGNPRKAMDRSSLEGLAASIRNDGLLQNLVVRPVKGIVSGERRFRALKLLEEHGEVDGDYAVPVEIRASLSKDDSRGSHLVAPAKAGGSGRLPRPGSPGFPLARE